MRIIGLEVVLKPIGIFDVVLGNSEELILEKFKGIKRKTKTKNSIDTGRNGKVMKKDMAKQSRLIENKCCNSLQYPFLVA